MANNKTEIDNETETEIDTEIDDMFKDEVSIDVKYDHYLCETCNKKYKIKKSFINHLTKIHNYELFAELPELELNIDKENEKYEQKINKKYPSNFRIPQKKFIKEGLTKLQEEELLKDKMFMKIKPINNETLAGLDNKLKQKLIECILNIDINCNYSILENFIRMYSIINSYKLNCNVVVLEENGIHTMYKGYRELGCDSIFDIIYRKIDSTRKLIIKFIQIESKNKLDDIDTNTIINVIRINFTSTIIKSFENNPIRFELEKILYNFHVNYIYSKTLKLYSEEIPLFYNYRDKYKKNLFNISTEFFE
jgi:hypothetical protein